MILLDKYVENSKNNLGNKPHFLPAREEICV